MTRSNKSSSVVILLINLFLILFCLSSSAKAEKSKLNLILITIDTLRADRLSCYSDKYVKTPHIDALAERSVIFTKSFAHNPLTLPSHTNILLGTTPLSHGVQDNVDFVVRPEFLTIAEHLKKYGYSTGAFIGAAPLDSRFGLDQGFDLYDDDFISPGAPKFTEGERKAEEVIKPAWDWIKKQKQPWFAWLHLFDPHYSYDPPEPFKSKYQDRPYDGEAAYVDSELGRFMGYLDSNGLLKNTIVIITSDHGESLGEHGEQTHGILAYNASLWVPLIIYVPGNKPGTVEDFTAHIDIFPTVCDVLDMEIPNHLQGISLCPAMQGKSIGERTIYFESLEPFYRMDWAPLRGFIRGNYKFFDSPIPELYDLDSDFSENKNLIDAAKLPAYKQQLDQLMQAQVSGQKPDASQKTDSVGLRKLRSLGYITSSPVGRKRTYGPEDDIKSLLPLYNQIIQAYRLRESNKTKEGIAALENIIKQENRLDIAYVYLAKLYGESLQINVVLETLRKGYKTFPFSYEILELYCEFLMHTQNYDEIIRVLRSDQPFQMEQDPELWTLLGLAYTKMGQNDEALQAFEISVSIDPEYADTFNYIGSIYLSKYLQTHEKEFFAKAVKNLQRVIELDLEYVSAYNSLGAAYMTHGDMTEAIRSWEKVIEINPRAGKTYYYLGLAYISQGDMTKARLYLVTLKNEFYHLFTHAEKENFELLLERVK